MIFLRLPPRSIDTLIAEKLYGWTVREFGGTYDPEGGVFGPCQVCTGVTREITEPWHLAHFKLTTVEQYEDLCHQWHPHEGDEPCYQPKPDHPTAWQAIPHFTERVKDAHLLTTCPAAQNPLFRQAYAHHLRRLVAGEYPVESDEATWRIAQASADDRARAALAAVGYTVEVWHDR